MSELLTVDPAAQRDQWYPTPDWVTEALLDMEHFEQGLTWEPACGDGRMVEVLRESGLPVMASDLHDRGYGVFGVDFLTFPPPYGPVQNIVTNPPYALAEEFVHRALEVAERKVAMLLRLAFLEGSGRYERLFSVAPPTRIWVFSERITMYPGGVQTGGSGTMAMMWAVWDKTQPGRVTQLDWLNGYKPKSPGAQR